jgi:nucleoside-diphosphate-sugar epimerase
MSTYLVTGGAGFIGSNIVEALLEHGAVVRVLDNFLTGRRENLAPFEGRFTLIEGDIRDRAAVRRAVQGCDFVLHQAALPSVPRSIADPETSHDINVTGTFNVLMAAREAKVKRVVFAASSAAYGESTAPSKREDLPVAPISPYGAGKVAGEAYCAAFSASLGLECVALRYFNVFGPRQDPKSQYAAVVPLFIQAVMQGRPPLIYGDGEQSRDFTYVANVVQANLLAATAPRAAGRVINVACGESITVNALAAAIGRAFGVSVRPTYAPPRAGDIRYSLADISLARQLLGYEPQVTFDAGMALTCAWFRTKK